MPFTTFEQGIIKPGIDGGRFSSYYHPEDISIIMNQPGAMAVHAIPASVGDPALDCTILIAVQHDKSGNITAMFTGPNNLAALPCPPYTREGGEFLKNPQPASR
jgi:hypothetical protein